MATAAEFLLEDDCPSLREGEEDDDEDTEAEEEGVALEVAGLDAAEGLAGVAGDGFGAADAEAVDEEGIEDAADGGDGVLTNGDDFGVEFVEVELVSEELDIERFGIAAPVEFVSAEDAEGEGEQGDDGGNADVDVEELSVFLTKGRAGESETGDGSENGEDDERCA
jgi:hypothetical protein